MHVFVGLSGGVDSAVAAHLLMKEGHRVQGIFVRIWQPEFTHCTMEADRLSAKRVAAHLGIPFHELDLSELYRTAVIQDLLDGYRRGETPNPDILCNQHIKFGALLDQVQQLGGEYLATGHYARVEHTKSGSHLLRGLDGNKDQTYFLARMTPRMLQHALFPLGALEKKDVRILAESITLPNAHRPDSQGLCFVGPVTMEEFLKQYIAVSPGKVLNEAGDSIGQHQGAALYTIGQRHGFVVHATQPDGAPRYVVATDVMQNTITVAPTVTIAERLVLPLRNLSWFETPHENEEVTFQVRYRQSAQKGTIDPARGTLTAHEPQIAAAGQTLVMYRGDRCLGAGTLDATPAIHSELV